MKVDLDQTWTRSFAQSGAVSFERSRALVLVWSLIPIGSLLIAFWALLMTDSDPLVSKAHVLGLVLVPVSVVFGIQVIELVTRPGPPLRVDGSGIYASQGAELFIPWREFRDAWPALSNKTRAPIVIQATKSTIDSFTETLPRWRLALQQIGKNARPGSVRQPDTVTVLLLKAPVDQLAVWLKAEAARRAVQG